MEILFPLQSSIFDTASSITDIKASFFESARVKIVVSAGKNTDHNMLDYDPIYSGGISLKAKSTLIPLAFWAFLARKYQIADTIKTPNTTVYASVLVRPNCE